MSKRARQMNEQQLPRPGAQSVTAAVRALLDERERKGIDAVQYTEQWRLEREQLLAELSDALKARDAWAHQCNLTSEHQADTAAAASRLRTMVHRLVGAMKRWGAEEDGVPEAGPGLMGSIGGAFEDALALLKEIPGPEGE